MKTRVRRDERDALDSALPDTSPAMAEDVSWEDMVAFARLRAGQWMLCSAVYCDGGFPQYLKALEPGKGLDGVGKGRMPVWARVDRHSVLPDAVTWSVIWPIGPAPGLLRNGNYPEWFIECPILRKRAGFPPVSECETFGRLLGSILNRGALCGENRANES